MDLVQDLQRQGWYLSENGIKECSKSDSVTAEGVIREALNLDLKEIGEKHLPENLGKSKTEFVDGPFILQIQKLRNVLVPKESDQSEGGGGGGGGGGQKLMRLILTDGQGTCTAIDMSGISGLGCNTPPGSKVKLLGRVPVSHGFLLLSSSNCKFLGGRVEKLVESWELKRSLAAQNRAAVNQEGGPPPFIPFGQRRKDTTPGNNNKRDNFRSLDSLTKKKESDCDFEQQRKAIIEAALQEGKAKTFGTASTKQQAQSQSDKNIASLMEMGFSVEDSNAALRKSSGRLQDAVSSLLGDNNSTSNHVSARHSTESRQSGAQTNRPQSLMASDRPDRSGGRRRGGRAEEAEDYSEQHTKPSAPATLFDFVTNMIPKKTDKTESRNHPASEDNSASSKIHQSTRDEAKTNEKHQEYAQDDCKTPEDGRGDKKDASSSVNYGANHSSTYHSSVQNLPPRLQKKQKEEEEKQHKYGSKDTAYSDWTRDRMSNKVYDVHSRGPVSNKNLWIDDKDDRGKDRNPDRREKRGGAGKAKTAEDAKLGSEVQTVYLDGGRMQHEVTPLLKCTPLMQCTTDGVQLIQSMSALHLCPAASVQVAPTHASTYAVVPTSMGRDANVAAKENIRWKSGDICMAKWQDKKFYAAKVIRVKGKLALVNFVDYGNDVSQVSFSDLMPMGASDTSLLFQPTIQPTSGIYSSPGSTSNIIYPSHNGHFNAGPVSGMIVQGPGAYPTDHSCRIVTNSTRVNGSKTKRPPAEKQPYVPPPQRK